MSRSRLRLGLWGFDGGSPVSNVDFKKMSMSLVAMFAIFMSFIIIMVSFRMSILRNTISCQLFPVAGLRVIWRF